MKTASLVSQILLGLMFSFGGVSGYLAYHVFRSGVSLAQGAQLISALRFGHARS